MQSPLLTTGCEQPSKIERAFTSSGSRAKVVPVAD